MNKSFLIAIAAALMAAPLAIAHDPVKGTPKNYCEPQSEWFQHDYATGTGLFILLNEDGNLLGDCDGVVTADPGTPCAGADPADPVNTFFVGLCDSDINPPVADYDGHREFALGGAWILAGASAEDCFGDAAHHTEFGSFTVDDTVLGAGATADVAADTVDATGQLGTCGDFESDVSESFIGGGTVSIPAGLDGSYQVYVTGSLGHVNWP
jgi:hypothetical protein